MNAHRCPFCNRLLLMMTAIGPVSISIKCDRCKHIVNFTEEGATVTAVR